ncbi:MAG: peptidase inhibitor family I36 protein [Acidobacteria bacterium]|nr:peptidase inhibitor family I36 protein [Acidobacteriota bacterium]
MKRIIGFTFLTLFVFSLIQVFGPGLPAQSRVWNQGHQPREGVCFYVDADYKGEEFCVEGNDTQRNLEPRYNDRVSSVRLFGGANLTVFEDSNYQGSSQTYSRDVANLRNWGDRISSFQIRGDRRTSQRSDSRSAVRNDGRVRGTESREGVCFYSDTNYQGDEICVEGNESLRQLDTRFKNKISSIRVSRGAQVTVFANQNFSGRSQSFSQDDPNLQNWSNRIASFQVRMDPQYDGRDRGPAGRQYDRWVRESRQGVCFYADTNYQGDEICVEGNQSLRQLDTRFKNKISSVRVSSGAQVTVFANPNFNGRSQVFSRDDANLQNWSNRIASFQVQMDPQYGGRDRGPTGRQDGWVRNSDSDRRVCFYRDSNYKGEEMCVTGTGNQQKIDNRFDDEISSIRVYGGAQVTVYEHVNFGGTRRVITQDTPGLGNLNDKITSIEVR